MRYSQGPDRRQTSAGQYGPHAAGGQHDGSQFRGQGGYRHRRVKRHRPDRGGRVGAPRRRPLANRPRTSRTGRNRAADRRGRGCHSAGCGDGPATARAARQADRGGRRQPSPSLRADQQCWRDASRADSGRHDRSLAGNVRRQCHGLAGPTGSARGPSRAARPPSRSCVRRASPAIS